MTTKPTYAELEKHVEALTRAAEKYKTTEASLRNSNDTLTSLLASSPVAIGIVEHRIFRRVNATMLHMFGFTRESDYLDQSARVIYPSQEAYEAVGRIISGNLKLGKIAQIDTLFQRKDGSTFFGHLKVSTQIPSNPMERATFTISDISWRKQAEQERLEKEKLMGVIELAGAVCHELNQPMQTIVFEYSKLSPADNRAGDAVAHIMKNIKQQIGIMRQLTRKLMRITRYETREYIGGGKIIDIDKSSNQRPAP